MVNTQEPANRKSISSLHEEIDYLREQNHSKTQIIKHLTDMKVVPSNNDIATGACSCKLASTHIYCVNSNYKEPLIDLEINTKSNKHSKKSETSKTKISLKSSVLIISTKRTKNESTTQRITPRKKRKRTRENRKLYIF